MLRNTKNSTQNTHTDRNTLKLFWQASAVYKPLLFTSLLFPAGIILSNVVAPLFISKTLGALALPGENPMGYFTLFLIAAGCGLIFNRIGHPALMRHQALVSRDMQTNALVTLLKRSVGFHHNNISGKVVSDAIDYPAAYAKLADTIAVGLVPLATILLIGSAVIYYESLVLGFSLTFMTALVIGLGIYDSRWMAPRRILRLEASKNVTSHLADTLTNVQAVKTFGREDQELAEHKQLNEKLAQIRISDWQIMSTRGNNRIILLVTMQAILVFIIIQLVQQNPALLSVSIFAFTFTVMLSNRLFEVNMHIRNLEEALLQASPMTKIMLDTPEIQDQPHATALAVKGGEVAFADVTFAYQDDANKEAVFRGLNLKIAPGEKIGLVGPSGGGKSTLTRLLLRFDDIEKGKITVDDQNIATITQHSLRQAIAYVPQEPLLFHRSIQENIGYGRPGATLDEIKHAAKLAHADNFIEKLHRSYDTIVGERGVKLSGGQRQRIAIARAILKDAPILILDEATSALDSESEALIQDALWKLMEGRTAIVVAHRLSTIQKMDRVVVLDDGHIIEQGTHAQLLEKGGLYAKLWAHQSGGFIN